MQSVRGGGLHSVMAKVVDISHEVSKFELQSHYYILFQTNVPRERYEPSYPPPAMG